MNSKLVSSTDILHTGVYDSLRVTSPLAKVQLVSLAAKPHIRSVVYITLFLLSQLTCILLEWGERKMNTTGGCKWQLTVENGWEGKVECGIFFCRSFPDRSAQMARETGSSMKSHGRSRASSDPRGQPEMCPGGTWFERGPVSPDRG